MDTEILVIKEAAEVVRLHPSTLYKYCESRRIPHMKVGRKLLFKKSLLLEWLDSKIVGMN